jgi:hypothetical protein
MKHTIMFAAFIPACFALSCGTKKDEKKVPVVVSERSNDSVVPTTLDSQKPCDGDAASQNLDDVSQNQSCASNVPVGELRVLQKTSWLNPEFDAGGRLQNDEGDCLDAFTASLKDQNSTATLDLVLKNMGLKNNAVRCLTQVRVGFAKGYTFALRKVTAPIVSEIPEDARTSFLGTYGIQGKASFTMDRKLNPQYSGKAVRLEYSVANEDLVWSSCGGEATLRFDTRMLIDFNRSSQNADIRLDTRTPYRMEIVWARCQ